ncbi:AAA family ATPase [Amphibiibacter pelophylacis]|uniref:ATP-binding protein n=1 Tax=Amphibiibacter pelophylacis TaxID=1799477 RepID=A0ACC6NY28_9BURK
MGDWVDSETRKFNPPAIRAELRRKRQRLEKQADTLKLPELLSRNLTKLAELVNLSATELQILGFVICLHGNSALRTAATLLYDLTTPKCVQALSAILRVESSGIRKALSGQSALVGAGLITLAPENDTLDDKLNILSPHFVDQMLHFDIEPDRLLAGMLVAADDSHLTLTDYEHIQTDLDILLPHLRQALQSNQRGVNILIHGDPGTGKTQLVRVIAAQLEHSLYEVASEDSEGDPISGSKRLSAFRLAQRFFARQRALIVFDEIEDVFSDEQSLGAKSTAQRHKAWLNRMLESNPAPSFWISNDISSMDPAFIRRFDLSLKLTPPPRKQRERILQQTCQGLLDAEAIRRLSLAEHLAPAVVARAAAVVQPIQAEIGVDKTVATLERLINNTLIAQGNKPLAQPDRSNLPQVYDPAFIHADADLAGIADTLKTRPVARLCLYGPPGTGKTAYGRWLAQQLDRPLHVKRASDLLSMYVGEAEKNIARAFRSAQRDDAVLMIDEVDTFLQDRRGAQRSWEVSQVNEMLTQIEAYSGVLVVSTNLMDQLDPAAMRRFDLKVRFDYLRSEQAQELLQRHCAQLKLPEPCPDELRRMSRIKAITPGDFAVAVRQSGFRCITSASDLITVLERECEGKEGARVRVGFV